MKVKIHLYQLPIPTLSSSQSPSRITIVSSLVLILLKISMLHIYFLKICNFKRNQTDTHCSRACFSQCNIFIVRTYGSNLIFLSYLVWMCHICFATPQVTFKLSLICDHCRQCCTAHPYTHMRMFLWDDTKKWKCWE